MPFYDKLRKAQRDTENPVFFEEALTEAFERLGLGSKHIGGRDEPDVLLEVLGHKIVIDAKTAKDPISEPRIGFPALERYKESYGADHVGVVAIGFRKGVVRTTAKKSGVTLIETEAIYKALQNHMDYPYNPHHIYEILFGRGKTVITPRDIDSSTKNMRKQIEMIRKVLSDLDRFQKSGRKFNVEKAVVAYSWESVSLKKDEVEEVLTFLSSPPFNIVKKEGDVYSLTMDYDEMRKRFGILREALPREEKRVIEPGKEKGRKKRGISIQGEFVPCRRSKDILIETAEWLIKRDKLKVPIEAGYKRYLVSREPKHRNGQAFTAGEKLTNGWWIETHYSTASCIKYAKNLLKECGFTEEDLDVRGFGKK